MFVVIVVAAAEMVNKCCCFGPEGKKGFVLGVVDVAVQLFIF